MLLIIYSQATGCLGASLDDVWFFFSNGVSHGPATLYLTNGDTEERTYENGVLHGIATFASHNGDREERYVNFFWKKFGLRSWTKFFILVFYRCYKSGRLDGTAKYYYTSGAIESRIYESGILQGTI